LWSRTSVSSKWVKTEASEGDRRGILIPVLIDDVKIPLAFRRIHAADLKDWGGKLPYPGFGNLLKAVAGILGRPVQPSQKTNEVRDVVPEKVNILIKKDQRSWYRNPTYLTFIAFIAAAIIISLVWVSTISSPPADFSIAISPMQGEVHQGGVITTAITIKGIQGYEHPVALSTNVQPSGIAVSFVPPIGEPTPSYTSTVTINVDSSVLKDNYKIVMTGTGADGKEHSGSYTISETSIRLNQYPAGPVTRGTWINFTWMIIEPPSYLAGEHYILEILGPTNEKMYSQDFLAPRESCSNFTGYYSWMVPIDEPMGRHTSLLKIPNLVYSSIKFDVIDTLLVIQKLDDKDKRLPGWEFKVTDPGWNTATYTTDSRGEIRIQVPVEHGGETYTIEEIYEPNWEPELPIKQTVKVPVGEVTTVQFLNKQVPIPVE
jgi:hypothetical protein